MTTLAHQSNRNAPPPPVTRVALVGNPNTGKTTLFNRLCGMRARTANVPGSTVEARIGSLQHKSRTIEIVDLPGHYGLNLNRPESRICRDYLNSKLASPPPPDAVLVVADATNLSRNLIFVSQAIQQGLRAVVAVNMIDIAQRRGLSIDVEQLATRIGCPIVPVCARTGEGIPELIAAIDQAHAPTADLPNPNNAHAAAEWADDVVTHSIGGDHAVGKSGDSFTDRLDLAFTHPILGLVVFALIMTGLFFTIFTIASVPMDLIDVLFASLGEAFARILPAGAIEDLMVDGVVAGIAGTVVFLPQICLLFFLLTLLEDTGYLARAAFVMDRLLRPFGLPGQSFVPLLSAHACAIPAIMSARLVPDSRDRLATILVAPFLSCSARVPVYVLLTGMLFVDRPLIAALAFAGCYVLGAIAAIISSLIARRTILRGPSPAMVLELPTYKIPSLRTALLTTIDRAWSFLKNAGTVILAICIILWWLGAYPNTPAPAEATRLAEQAQQLAATDPDRSEALLVESESLTARNAQANSYIGRIGRTIEPVFAPIGADWQLSIGIMSSFAAREVFVSTMAVVIAGSDADPTEDSTIRERIESAERADGTPVFTIPAAASMLVFFVLAMQCLPTLAVTAREAGGWKWALLQFAWMSAVAWIAAFAIFQSLSAAGFA